MTSLRLGTRGSALAMAQSGATATLIGQAAGIDVDLVHIRTDGDVLTGSLATMGGTGVFVTAIRQALLNGDIDVAVHSLKDLPTAPQEGTIIIVPERESPQDALCSRHGEGLDLLPDGALVGTGSPRRAAQLLEARPDLRIVDIRGNVDTRLARAGLSTADKPNIPNDLDAVVLATAGLRRLGRAHVISELLPPATMLPAPGQGALAVEVRAELATEHPGVFAALRTLHHTPTALAVTAERALLRHLEAGCAAPVGALATVHQGTMHLTGIALDPRTAPVGEAPGADVRDINAAPLAMTRPADARPPLRGEVTRVVATDEDARQVGVELAESLLAEGAAEFLRG
ncbi:hydroxymethylbilane synthase [Jonesia quinghaiensis]|uniref:hydroxymethylbilane synthase n=1 Tax=Jonesia quinghaiensis TaxID=262806 RepID=UPI00048D7319|nr:hydroxymethylbilane synthase [Jonesia quinghaiensis]